MTPLAATVSANLLTAAGMAALHSAAQNLTCTSTASRAVWEGQSAGNSPFMELRSSLRTALGGCFVRAATGREQSDSRSAPSCDLSLPVAALLSISGQRESPGPVAASL